MTAVTSGIAAGEVRSSLYDRLGGQDGVANIAHTPIDRASTER
jgi:hypothetical protein